MIGGLAAFLALISFVVAHEAGHYFAAKATGMKVTEFFIGFGPRIWSFRRGETEYGIKPIPFGAYVKVAGMSHIEDVAPEDEGRTYREKPFWAKSLVVLSGVGANFFLAFLIFSGLALWEGRPVIVDGEPVLTTSVRAVVPESDGKPTAAALAGMEAGDRIVAADGVPIDDWAVLTESLAGRPGETVTITVERDAEQVVLEATLGERKDPETGEVVGFLGIAPAIQMESLNVFQAAGLGGRQVAAAVPLTLQSFGQLFRLDTITTLLRGLTGAEIPDDSRPVSPVGIVQIGSQATEFGIGNFVAMLAIINVFLGTLNVIPLFPLDGGHFAVALYEKLTGRRANMDKLIPVAVTVIVIISAIGLLAIALDIVNPIDL
jgi:membrane-associated protease RseP (regulator of RpoE activity)